MIRVNLLDPHSIVKFCHRASFTVRIPYENGGWTHITILGPLPSSEYLLTKVLGPGESFKN